MKALWYVLGAAAVGGVGYYVYRKTRPTNALGMLGPVGGFQPMGNAILPPQQQQQQQPVINVHMPAPGTTAPPTNVQAAEPAAPPLPPAAPAPGLFSMLGGLTPNEPVPVQQVVAAVEPEPDPPPMFFPLVSPPPPPAPPPAPAPAPINAPRLSVPFAPSYVAEPLTAELPLSFLTRGF